MCELGLADQLVGRTGFCIHPKEALKKISKVGGTKSVDLKKIRELAPTHVIVNVDENKKETADALVQFVPHVIVTHPLAPLDNLALYRQIGKAFGKEPAAELLCDRFNVAFRAVQDKSFARKKALYLIWKDPWMTVSRDTYISRTLAAVGWDTIDIESKDRYPEVRLTPDFLLRADRVLLSTEPYAFLERHLDEIRQMLAAGANDFVPTPMEESESPVTVSLIDGEMTSWYGSRAIKGMKYLSRLRTG